MQRNQPMTFYSLIWIQVAFFLCSYFGKNMHEFLLCFHFYQLHVFASSIDQFWCDPFYFSTPLEKCTRLLLLCAEFVNCCWFKNTSLSTRKNVCVCFFFLSIIRVGFKIAAMYIYIYIYIKVGSYINHNSNYKNSFCVFRSKLRNSKKNFFYFLRTTHKHTFS